MEAESWEITKAHLKVLIMLTLVMSVGAVLTELFQLIGGTK
ncbi:hypothetical protein SEA_DANIELLEIGNACE_38 [Arthrobacter phage DanielleIgnace]|nr:hypothetical protein SEA_DANIELLEIGNACE_38 [Arthrobacter phage DanielleIgnace]